MLRSFAFEMLKRFLAICRSKVRFHFWGEVVRKKCQDILWDAAVSVASTFGEHHLDLGARKLCVIGGATSIFWWLRAV